MYYSHYLILMVDTMVIELIFSTNHQTELGQMYWGQVGKFPEVLDVNFVPGNADVSQPETIVGILWGYYDIKPTM